VRKTNNAKLRASHAVRKEYVVLTVLLATRNRSRIFASVLESFCQLRPPFSGWKLLVVDNGSTDQTSQVVASFANRLPLQSLTEPRVGKNIALNAGLAHLDGDLIVLTDDDAFPHEDWLIQLRNAADAQGQFSIFGGSVVPRREVPPPPWTQWLDERVVYAISDPAWKEGPIAPNLVWGLNMAIRSDVFQSGIRFDISMGPRGSSYPMGGETELILRLHAHGHKAWHVRGAVVEHLIRKQQLSRAWVMQRAINYGRGEFRLQHADEIKSRKLLLRTAPHLFRELQKQALGMTKACVRRRQQNLFSSYWRFNFVRGQIWEWLLNMLVSQNKA
jgi:glycosyltransferase involved in cell wall biosynthesis